MERLGSARSFRPINARSADRMENPEFAAASAPATPRRVRSLGSWSAAGSVATGRSGVSGIDGFAANERDAVIDAADEAGMIPGSFVRKAVARAVAHGLHGGGLTRDPPRPAKRTFRGVGMSARRGREEIDGSDGKDLFDRAAADAETARDETPGADEPNAATLASFFRIGSGAFDP